MKRKWGSARLDAYLQTDHGRAFTKCGGVVSGIGSQMAICVRKLKDYTQQLRDLGYSNAETNNIAEKRVLDEFVVKRRDLIIARADKLDKQAKQLRKSKPISCEKADKLAAKAKQLRKLAFTVRVRKSKTRSPSRRRLRFQYSLK